MSAPTTIQLRDRQAALAQVRQLAELMDSRFKVPGTDFRFGLESIVGLLPVGGDAIGFVASAGLVLTMARHGASPRLVALMLVNVAIDAFVGAIPVLGDLFDVVYKANNRNVRLLERHYAEGKYEGSAWPVVLLALVVLGFIAWGLVWVLWTVGAWLVSLAG